MSDANNNQGPRRYQQVRVFKAESIRERVAKLNAKFTKKNLPQVTVAFGEVYSITDPDSREQVRVVDLELDFLLD